MVRSRAVGRSRFQNGEAVALCTPDSALAVVVMDAYPTEISWGRKESRSHERACYRNGEVV
jgi:hypothetical protein